jgi:hypothetical protein
VTPSGSPEVFKNLIDYIDKEIALVLCGEDEAGRAEAGSRASSQVANTIRVVKASELSEMLSQTLTQTLVRWVVDLNFGMDVASPVLTREFRIEESSLTMPDVSLMIQSGYTPRKEWIERHFRVELEEKDKEQQGAEGGEGETTYDPQQDQNLFDSIFGGAQEGSAPQTGAPAEGPTAETPTEASTSETPTETLPPEAPPVVAPAEEPQTENVANAVEEDMAPPPGATPEESQADAIDTSSELTPEQLHELLGTTPDEEVTGEVNPDDMTEEEIMNLLGFPPD